MATLVSLVVHWAYKLKYHEMSMPAETWTSVIWTNGCFYSEQNKTWKAPTFCFLENSWWFLHVTGLLRVEHCASANLPIKHLVSHIKWACIYGCVTSQSSFSALCLIQAVVVCLVEKSWKHAGEMGVRVLSCCMQIWLQFSLCCVKLSYNNAELSSEGQGKFLTPLSL